MFGTGCHKHGVVFGRQVPKAYVLAHFHVLPEFHAGVQEHLFIDVAELFVQAEGRDAVTQHAAHAGVGVKNGDLCACLVQPDGCRNARGTCAHNCNPVIGMLQRMAFQAVSREELTGDFLLNLVPTYGFLFGVEHAVAVAELLPVTYQGGDRAQRIVAEQQGAGLFQPALAVKGHALRDGGVHGTAFKGAFGLLAKQAA